MKTHKPTTAILLWDARERISDGTFPIKLRVTWNRERKYYATKFTANQEMWKRVKSEKPRTDAKELILELNAVEQKAKTVISEIPNFSFREFEERFFEKEKKETGVFQEYENRIAKLRASARIGTAVSYESSLASLKTFGGNRSMHFEDITLDFLNRYEKSLLVDSA